MQQVVADEVYQGCEQNLVLARMHARERPCSIFTQVHQDIHGEL